MYEIKCSPVFFFWPGIVRFNQQANMPIWSPFRKKNTWYPNDEEQHRFCCFHGSPPKKTCPPKFCFTAPKQIFVWRRNTQRFTSSMTAVKRQTPPLWWSQVPPVVFAIAEAPNSVTEKATSDPIGQSNGLCRNHGNLRGPTQWPYFSGLLTIGFP